MPQQDFLKTIITEVGLALGTLRTLTSPAKAVAFFRDIGFELPPAAFGGRLPNVSARSNDLFNAVGQLSLASGDAAVAAAKAQVLAQLTATMDAVRQMIQQVQASGPGFPSVAEFTARFTDFLLLDFLRRQHGELFSIGHVLGLIDDGADLDSETSGSRIHWERLGQFLTQPSKILDDAYGWNTEFDSAAFLGRLRDLLRALGLPGGFYPPRGATALGPDIGDFEIQELRAPIFQAGLTPETYSQFGITFSPAEAQGSKKKGVALLPYLMGTSKFDFEVCDRGELLFESTADIRGIGIVVRPPFSAEGLLNLTGPFHAAVKIREKPDRSEEIILIGSRGGTRLSIKGLGMNWFAEGALDKLDLGMEGEAQALRLVIAGGEGDGFLQKILSGLNVQAEVGFAFGITLLSGFTFRGGSKLALELGTHLDLGAVKVNGLRFALSPANDNIGLEAGALLKFDIGPLSATVEGIGLRSAIYFRPGNLGPADLDVSFKPPNGVGLSLDAGGFKGGGFLMFDHEKGEYAGALELDFQGICSVKAVGIINTKMPDGSSGFSLLILISAEFTPIQLSFGFTLNGVGGIIGLNRTIDEAALVEGVRTNAIKSILFPENVVANISRIISDIKQFFPPLDDHFVVGPMGKLGWGTPSLITLELGLLLDLPNPMFAIVGVLKAVLPTEDLAILRLQVNFIGILDFERGYVFFRADLYDSRLLVFSITGSLAFLVSWGEQQTFAVSVGGFHPDFRDFPSIPALPDGFRNMARIGITACFRTTIRASR
jgi:hypothetical protein